MTFFLDGFIKLLTLAVLDCIHDSAAGFENLTDFAGKVGLTINHLIHTVRQSGDLCKNDCKDISIQSRVKYTNMQHLSSFNSKASISTPTHIKNSALRV